MNIDKLVNTKAKRHCVFLLVTFALILKAVFQYGSIASRLMALTTYSDVFQLLDLHELSWTYLSRMLVSFVGIGQWDFLTIMKVLLQSIRFEGMITLICFCTLLYSWRNTHPRLRAFVSISFLITACFCVIFIYQGFQSSTLLEVVDALQRIGLVVLLLCVTYGFLCIYSFLQVAFVYRDILPIDAIKIEE